MPALPAGSISFLNTSGAFIGLGFLFGAVLASKTLPNSWRGGESARFSYGFVAMKER